jgi:hypothetical protein
MSLVADGHPRNAKKNPVISGTCSVGMKTDVGVLFAMFYSSIERVS